MREALIMREKTRCKIQANMFCLVHKSHSINDPTERLGSFLIMYAFFEMLHQLRLPCFYLSPTASTSAMEQDQEGSKTLPLSPHLFFVELMPLCQNYHFER